jgi:SulP family sulfate permease
VLVNPTLVSLRVDESLYFANSKALEDHINQSMASMPNLQNVVLLCSAINDIDASALESLELIEARLLSAGIALHLSEVKGPVMDRLKHTHFLRHLSGKVFLTHYQAIQALSPSVTLQTQGVT